MRFEAALCMNFLLYLQECVRTHKNYTSILTTSKALDIYKNIKLYLRHEQALPVSAMRCLSSRYSDIDFQYDIHDYHTTGNTAVDYDGKLYLFYAPKSRSDSSDMSAKLRNLDGVMNEDYVCSHETIRYTYCTINFINVSYLRVLGWEVITEYKQIKKLAPISKSLLDPRLFPYQVEGVRMLASGFRLMADEQGCVAADSKVWIKEQGKSATRSVSIATLSRLYEVDKSIKIKTMCNGRFVYMPIKAVVNKGVQHTIKVTLQDRSLICTPDHLLYTDTGWIEAGKLSVGSQVFTNGKQVCPVCGTDKDVSTEAVHHINGIKSDNRFENLQLLSINEHCKLHSDVSTKYLYQYNENLDYIYHNGTKVTLVPELQKVIRVDNHEDTEVWDIVIGDADIHNFICNGIVVHNCGKTAQVLQYVELEGLRKVLIVCPATLKLNWKREVLLWTHTTEERIAVLYGTHPYDVKARFTIINYDLLHYWKDYLSKQKYELICCDECHYIQSATAQRTKAFVAVAKHANDKIFMSGTPFTSRPLQMYTALHNIAPRVFKTQYDYGMRFCHPFYFGNQLKFNGASNTQLLHDILSDGICIRRLKQDVLKDLPEKLRVVVSIGLTPEEVRKSAVKKPIKELEQKIREASDVISTLEYQRQIAYLRKRDLINDWIRDFLESDKKLVVFGVHKSTLDSIQETFPDITVRIDGSTPNKLRDENVYKFQNDPNIKLFVGNVQAAGTGITLTAASDVLMVEQSYSYSCQVQAEDRIHRIGAKNACMIYYAVCPNTIDECIVKAINDKAKDLQLILDGKVNDKLISPSNCGKYEYIFN